MTSVCGSIFVVFWVSVGAVIAAYGLRVIARQSISIPGYDVTRGTLRAFYEGPPAILIGTGLMTVGLALALSTIGSLLNDTLRLIFGLLFCASPVILAVLTWTAWRRYGPIRIEER